MNPGSNSVHDCAFLQRVPVFSELTPERITELAASITRQSYEAGQIILTEGERGGDMYVVETGSVQVYSKGFNGEDVVLARLNQGQSFGEQALLAQGSRRRNASVRALNSTTLLVISRHHLLTAIAEHAPLAVRLRAMSVDHVQQRRLRLQESILNPLGASLPAGAYTFETYVPGQIVFRQGDTGDKVHLILSGTACVTHADGQNTTEIAQLGPGQFFGERAILQAEPRWATITAITPLETASIDGGWFQRLQNESPQLRALTQSLSRMYLLPSVGMLVLQTGHLGDQPVVTSTHQLADGRTVLSTHLASSASFVSRVIGTLETETIAWEAPDKSQYRLIGIHGKRIVSIFAEGEWAGLGEALLRLLEGQTVADWELKLFGESGDLKTGEPFPIYEPRQILCTCTKATCGQVQDAIRQGCHDLPSIAAKTGVTSVCGGCTPLVQDLLGRPDFTPATIVSSLQLAPAVRAFRIRPNREPIAEYLPGQYVVLQTRIDDHWVQRSYTLSAPYQPDGDYEITVKREPRGIFSDWLFSRAAIGQSVRISKPLGTFCLPEQEASDVICLVGGIGVTPALSMARALAMKPNRLRFHVDYSVSEMGHAICCEELERLTKSNSALSVRVRCTRTDGRITRSDIHSFLAESPDALFFVCGSERFLDGVTVTLKACGVASENIRTEAFAAAGEKPISAAAHSHTPVCPVNQVSVGVAARTPQEEAFAFLRDYYKDSGLDAVLPSRLVQVEDEFRNSGTYRQTAGELTFAARLAWRNSVRCIGRLYWQGLTVRDFRHVATAGEMLDALIEHVELATNGGNIRPMMTVFAPEMPSQASARIWSTQLLRYAGYRQRDGSVLGDPANIQLTNIAISLGWPAPEPRTAFDRLPIIVKAANQAPEWRSIPQHLVKEARIEHPDFPWFADLKLKWYALPAVSNMLFDAGGVLYPAAPFNGWYMGTEIGARNFGDTYRYNLLPKVAQRMGLDTTRDASLWRDRALIELNAAVLYSFDKAGITILDHHAAAQSFDKFEELEKTAGRPIYGNWSWLVPPISGCAVSIFHRNWPEIELKPNYFAQPDPWPAE